MKRVFDFLVAFIVLLICLPILILVAGILAIHLQEWPLFSQDRPGLNGKLFRLYKLRTMKSLKDRQGNLLPDEKRLGTIGKLVRALSIDELPELWNVLIGNMSLVGPRPLLPEYLSLYNASQMRRHSVKPGITGWAQVNGRNLINWDQRFEMDLWYIDHWSFNLDTKILFMTVLSVIKKEGISAEGHVSMTKFSGSEKSSL